MSKQTDLVVKGGFGGGFEADAGQYISIIDLDGQQAGDFVALNRHDLSEGLSAVRTRRHSLSLYFRVGDQLLSSRDHPMLEVVADSIGIHDATVPACDPTRYTVDFGVDGHRNCLENMHEPLAPPPSPFALGAPTTSAPRRPTTSVEPSGYITSNLSAPRTCITATWNSTSNAPKKDRGKL